jgi:hypothetical protein
VLSRSQLERFWLRLSTHFTGTDQDHASLGARP